MYTHTYTHVNICMHTRDRHVTHTRIHTHKHTHTRTNTHTCKHANTRENSHTWVYGCMRMEGEDGRGWGVCVEDGIVCVLGWQSTLFVCTHTHTCVCACVGGSVCIGVYKRVTRKETSHVTSHVTHILMQRWWERICRRAWMSQMRAITQSWHKRTDAALPREWGTLHIKDQHI